MMNYSFFSDTIQSIILYFRFLTEPSSMFTVMHSYKCNLFVILHAFCALCFFFFNLLFQKRYLGNTIRVSNNLVTNQARSPGIIGPVPNCFQWLSADSKVVDIGGERHCKTLRPNHILVLWYFFLKFKQGS